jgi:NADH-quinone oxidoreductase subunit L
VPIFFSGFWSKDGILDAAHIWKVSKGPFYLGVFGALLTAFYMTRQVCYVFYGNNRESPVSGHSKHVPHESPGVMTIPLGILAVFAVLLGFIGTPAWPWFQNYLKGASAAFDFGELIHPDIISTLLLSTVIVAVGIGLGWWLYGRKPVQSPNQVDVLEKIRPDIFILLQNKFYVDEFYEATIIRFNAWCAWLASELDYWVWNGAVLAVSYLVLGLSWVNRFFDEYVVNLGFDRGCSEIRRGGKWVSHLQNGRVQNYLRVIGVALAGLFLFLMWGCQAS